MASGYVEPLVLAVADGPTLTAAAAATCLPVTGKYTFAPNALGVGSALRVTAFGRISNVVTTPGTARYDLRLGGNVIFDTGAMSLNTVAKTNLPWWLDIVGVIRAVGAAGTASFFGMGRWTSEAYINTAVATTGPGPGSPLSASASGVDSAPAAVTANFDTTVSNTFDCFFTQTVATGSMTVHYFSLESSSRLLA